MKINILLTVSLASVSCAFPQPGHTDGHGWQSYQACTAPIHPSLRFPPTVRNDTPSGWQAPPYAWIYGNWFVRYSSRIGYQSLYNFQADTYPLFPTTTANATARVNIDLTSWNLPVTGNATADDAVHTVYGYDTPQVDIAPYVFRFNGTGTVSAVSNTWELLAWGYDRNGDGWRAEFETVVLGPTSSEPCFNIVSRAEHGPDNQTYAEVKAALHKMFDNTELGVYVANITELHTDSRRAGLGPVACDEACVNNSNIN